MPLNVEDMAALKIPPKLRLSVRVLEVRKRRQYKLITEYGWLKGLEEHKELNLVEGGHGQVDGGQHPVYAASS